LSETGSTISTFAAGIISRNVFPIELGHIRTPRQTFEPLQINRMIEYQHEATTEPTTNDPILKYSRKRSRKPGLEIALLSSLSHSTLESSFFKSSLREHAFHMFQAAMLPEAWNFLYSDVQ
jgi:hypothetical protein